MTPQRSSPSTANRTWADFRAEMPISQKWAYFDHAGVAPITLATAEAIRHWADDTATGGVTHWKAWARQISEVRQLAAELVGAHTDEIALVHNTTAGIGLVADGFPWQSGDNVVTLANEFPSNLYPWMNLAAQGVECRQIEVADDGQIDLNRIAAACDANTRILAISWVGYASGYRNNVADLVELAHSNGALLFLDAIQGLGVFPLSVAETNVDFLAADGHKWLLGPEGAGIFYCRRQHLERLRPIGVGWNSVKHSHDFDHIELDLKTTAARYEGGTQNTPGFTGLAASLKCLLHFGAEQISERVLDVTDLLCDRLQEIDAAVASCRDRERASGIVSFDLPGRDLQSIRRGATDAGIVLNIRGGRLRVSPHAYNDESDIDRLVEYLGKP